MKRKILLSLFFIPFCFLTKVGLAQDSSLHHVDSLGHLYWKKATPVYLFISDTPEGQNNHRLRSKATEKYADPMYLDTEGINYIRSRYAVDPITKEQIPNVEITFEIFADGTAPTSSLSYHNAHMSKAGDQLYFQGGLQIEVSAEDKTSGVRSVKYSINRQVYTEVTERIIFTDQGTYDLSYYSEDNVGNIEEMKSLMFIIDNEPPVSEIEIDQLQNPNVISHKAKILINSQDSLSGVKVTKYQFDQNSPRSYTGVQLPIASLSEGSHKLTYYSEDKVGNEEVYKVFDFYLDRSAPLIVADILGDRFIVDDQIYFSGRTKLKLTTVDNKAGISEVKYSIDNQPFTDYSDPFYLPSVSGVHLVKYYAVDNLGNSTIKFKSSLKGERVFKEYIHQAAKFNVDLTGPKIDHTIENDFFQRHDTLFIGPKSEIKLMGFDEASGMKNLSYTVNRKVEEIFYHEPFTLQGQGFTTVEYFGYDNVNNRNTASFSFYLDTENPSVYINFDTGWTSKVDGIPSYPQSSSIYLAATDKTSGIKDIYYSLDGQKEKVYSNRVSGFSSGEHVISVRAIDVLLNETISTMKFIID